MEGSDVVGGVAEDMPPAGAATFSPANTLDCGACSGEAGIESAVMTVDARRRSRAVAVPVGTDGDEVVAGEVPMDDALEGAAALLIA